MIGTPQSGSVLAALAEFWHPVAWARDVSAEPHAVRLLDKELVLRRVDGAVRTRQGAAVERNGLVWLRLADSGRELPAFPPEQGDPSFRTVDAFDGYYRANAARFVENMMDQSHFPWVHENILGVRSAPQVSDITVLESTAEVFRYAGDHRMRYELTPPFQILYRVGGPQEGQCLTFLFIGTPISAKEMRSFGFVWCNYANKLSDAEIVARTRTLYEQDRVIVESQRPEELPLDLAEELHLRGADAAAVEYRRRLRTLGVTWE